MKQIFFSVLILFSARAFAGYSFVQETDVQDNNVAPFTTFAFPSATTTGNAIICTIMYSTPATVQSITDGGDSFASVGSVLAMTGNNTGYSLEVWYALSITGRASPSISFFFNGGTPGLVSAECAEYSGVTALDQHTSVMRTGVTTANIGPVTTVANNELSYIGATCNLANAFTNAGTGFAKRSSNNNDVMMEDTLALRERLSNSPDQKNQSASSKMF